MILTVPYSRGRIAIESLLLGQDLYFPQSRPSTLSGWHEPGMESYHHYRRRTEAAMRSI
jgi:hypothetical protein